MSESFVRDVESKAALDNYLADTSLVLVVEFWSKWCEDSKKMEKLFSRLSTLFPLDDALFLRVEAEDQFEISEAYDVNYLPQFVIVKNGKVFDTAAGVSPYDLAYTVAEAINPALIESVTEIAEQYRVDPLVLLREQLKPLINSHPLMLFMKGNPQRPKCCYSQSLVDILNRENLQFGTFDILLDNEVYEGLEELTDWTPLPQLYFKGELVGGCHQVIAMHHTGLLKEFFKDNPIPPHQPTPVTVTVEEPKSVLSQLYSYEDELDEEEEEDREEDKPIYLLCIDNGDQLYSYVIEEGNQKQNCLLDDDRPQTRSMTAFKTKFSHHDPAVLKILKTHPNTIVQQKPKPKGDCITIDYDHQFIKGNFTVVSQTNSKSCRRHKHTIIRALFLPLCPLKVSRTQLLVFNSLFYLLCGRHLSSDDHLEHNKTILLDIFNQTKGWETVDLNLFHSSSSFFISATTSNNGSVVLLLDSPSTRALFRKSINSTWKELPNPPGYLRFEFAQILAFTDTDIYWSIPSIISQTPSGCGPFYGVCFNLAKWEWYVFDRNNSFTGYWSQGVLFYDSYLFFAVTRKNDFFLRVYDLNACQWLPYEHPFPSINHKYRDTSLINPQLFQIRHNRLAIIWSDSVSLSDHYPLGSFYCTKFRIHKTSGDQPQVSATVISHGFYLVDGTLISSAVGVTVGDEDERDGKECLEIVQQGESECSRCHPS